MQVGTWYSSVSINCYTKKTLADNDTSTPLASGSQGVVLTYAIKGVASGVDAVGSIYNSNASFVTSAPGPSITPTGSVDLLMSFYMADGNGGSPTITVPAGQTPSSQMFYGGVWKIGVESLLSSSPTGTRTGTFSSSSGIAFNLAIK